MRKRKGLYGWITVALVLILVLCIVSYVRSEQGPVILMYHHLAPAGTYQGTADEDNGAILDVEHFAEQMAWLRENGYQTLFVSELADYLLNDQELPEKAVIITFDDGYESNYVYALPILEEYQIKANFAIVVRDTERREEQPDETPYADTSLRHMTFEQLREMVASGLVEVGSHTYHSHGDVNVDDAGNTKPALVNYHYNTVTKHLETAEEYQERVMTDLLKSREVLKAQLGKEPAYFAYPYGRYTNELIEIVEGAGFTVALSVKEDRIRSARQILHLPRYAVHNDLSLEDFADLVSYKWR